MQTNTTTKNGPAARPVAAGRALLWVVTSTLGAAVGIAVARPAAELVREPLSQVLDGMPTIALFGALFGGCVGLGHAVVRGRRSGLHPAWWVVTSTVCGAVGWLLGARLATIITDPIRGKVLVYVSEALGYLILGAVLGVVEGGLGLRRASGQGGGMGMVVGGIARSVFGWGLGFVVAAGVGLLITSLPSVTVRDLLFGGLIGLTAGTLEALAVARQTAT